MGVPQPLAKGGRSMGSTRVLFRSLLFPFIYPPTSVRHVVALQMFGVAKKSETTPFCMGKDQKSARTPKQPRRIRRIPEDLAVFDVRPQPLDRTSPSVHQTSPPGLFGVPPPDLDVRLPFRRDGGGGRGSGGLGKRGAVGGGDGVEALPSLLAWLDRARRVPYGGGLPSCPG